MTSDNGDRTDSAGMNRRDFLKRTASVGAAAAAGLGGPAAVRAAAKLAADAKAPAPKVERRNVKPGVLTKRLGRTNFMVSALSFGGNGLQAEGLGVFDTAIQRGMNFVMAHGGTSALTVGKWLKKPGNRERIFLGLAAGPGNIDAQLKALNAECVDLLMIGIHNAKAVGKAEMRDQFEALKKAGKARYACLVCHSNVPAVWRAALEAKWFDVLLTTYNAPSRDELKPLIPATKKLDMGLLTMKSSRALPKGGDYVAVCRTLLGDGVASIVRTISSVKQLDSFMPVARDRAKPAAAAMAVDCTGQCSLCGACDACPAGLAIQDVLRTYQYYARDLGELELAQWHYAQIPPQALAPACTDCGQCERLCPRKLPIRRLLRDAHVELSLDLAAR